MAAPREPPSSGRLGRHSESGRSSRGSPAGGARHRARPSRMTTSLITLLWVPVMLTTAKALTVDPAKRDMIVGTIANLRKFRFCGPSDDPDEQTAVTVGYRYLVTQLQRWVAPLIGDDIAERLNALDVEVNNIYSAYDVRAELDALLPDIETAIEALADRERSAGMSIRANPIPTAVCAVVGDGTLESAIYHPSAHWRGCFTRLARSAKCHLATASGNASPGLSVCTQMSGPDGRFSARYLRNTWRLTVLGDDSQEVCAAKRITDIACPVSVSPTAREVSFLVQ